MFVKENPDRKKKYIYIESVEGEESCISICSYSVTLSVANAVKMLEVA